MAPPRRLVVCTCTAFGCKEASFRNDLGERHIGRLLPSYTRSKHKKASAASQTLSDRVDKQPSLTLDQNIHDLQTVIFSMACLIAGWLHLACGVSREATACFLKMLQILLRSAIRLGFMMSEAKATPPHPSFSIPKDVRFVFSALSLEPIINRSVCCSRCFHHYDLESLPDICNQRESPRSRRCGQPLWRKRATPSGMMRVPERLSCTQDFHSWLEFFLSTPGVEDLIDKSYSHQPNTAVMRCIYDSPAWRSLGSFTVTKDNLTFSYFVDWFNPLTNKQAGKTVSCGAIMLFCLNLPYNSQHLPENTFFAGIIPPPKEPTVTTITAASDPIIDGLLEFWDGKVVKTHRHPEGVLKRVAILPVIGDLLAIRKALGFASVASHNTCSFCHIQLSDLENIDYRSWVAKSGAEVRQHAYEWKDAVTKKEKIEIFKEHGVRWSSLQRLHYRDHVQHTTLGVLHNWLEGVLQHQARVNWGIGAIKSTSMPANPTTPPPSPGSIPSPASTPSPLNVMNIDSPFDIATEVADLVKDSWRFGDEPLESARYRPEAFALEDDEVSTDSDETDSDFAPVDDIENTLSIFDETALKAVRACISDTTTPSWLARPPHNLGEKVHGKLKADQWLVLFTVYLPLVLPELWASDGSLDLLLNFTSLVNCTNILFAHVVTNDKADEYLRDYIKFRNSAAKLFPHAPSRPNHHLAMHNSDLMKYWGPLMPISEFAYERHNGMLQRISTNSHIWELDFTMLRQICRRGRLFTLLKAESSLDPDFVESILPSHGASFPISDRRKLSQEVYNLLMMRVTTGSDPASSYRPWYDFPHPDGAKVLSNHGYFVHRTIRQTRIYSTHQSHPGNSAIIFSEGEGHSTGFIQEVWWQIIDERRCTFLLVSPHTPLAVEDEDKNIYRLYPELRCQIFYSKIADRAQWSLIEIEQVVGHVAYFSRPAGTFGINSPIMVVADSLHRSR